jgi:hypothetical protein
MTLYLLLACGQLQDESPSKADATPKEEAYFESALECKECHPQQYAEWSTSMHAYAGISPVFDAMAAKAYRDSAGEVGTFCTGCHAPLGEIEGESGALQANERSAESKEGVTCDYCHTAIAHDGIIGNNRLLHNTEAAKYGPFGGTLSKQHSSERSDFIQSPELCGSCHDVFAYPGILIEQAYSEYTLSPAAEDGQTCQDCHMSPEPGRVAERAIGPIAIDPEGAEVYPDRELSSHRFVGPDYSLIDAFPFPEDLEASAASQLEQLQQIDVLLKNAVQISNVTLDETSSGSNSELSLTITVESLAAGHNVPTGFTSERQLWLEVKLYDGAGNLFFQSGALDENGDLYDAHSEAVRSGAAEEDHYLVNFQSQNIVTARQYKEDGALLSEGTSAELGQGDNPDNNGENEQQENGTAEEVRTEYETIFPFDADQITRRSLSPLEKRELPYVLTTNHSGPYRAEVALHYRNLPPYLLRALHLNELVERLHVFTIDTQETTFSSPP